MSLFLSDLIAERMADEQFLWCQQQALKLPITTQEVAEIWRIALGDRDKAEKLLAIWALSREEGSPRALMYVYLWCYARKPDPEAHQRWLRSNPRNGGLDITWLVLAANR